MKQLVLVVVLWSTACGGGGAPTQPSDLGPAPDAASWHDVECSTEKAAAECAGLAACAYCVFPAALCRIGCTLAVGDCPPDDDCVPLLGQYLPNGSCAAHDGYCAPRVAK